MSLCDYGLYWAISPDIRKKMLRIEGLQVCTIREVVKEGEKVYHKRERQRMRNRKEKRKREEKKRIGETGNRNKLRLEYWPQW